MESAPTEKLYVTPAEAMQILGISRSALYRLIADQKLPILKLGPRTTRIPLRRLREWAESQESVAL